MEDGLQPALFEQTVELVVLSDEFFQSWNFS
jgi:hypothetical protein